MNKIFAVLGMIILLLLVITIIPHNTVSNTAINTYLITLKNVPEGKGMYQQLININLSYPYGINSNGSNILFKDGSNNTFLYAWIQSINATNLQVWIKNYNNSFFIEMSIFPQYENLFSATGYLGYGREYFNAPYVFVYADDFTSFAGWNLSGTNGRQASITNNGLLLAQNGTTSDTINSNLTFNISMPVSGFVNITPDTYAGFGYTQDINGNGYTSSGAYIIGTGSGVMYDTLIAGTYLLTAISGVENLIGAKFMVNQTFSVWYSKYTFYTDYSIFGLHTYTNTTPIRQTGYHIMLMGVSTGRVIIPYVFVQSLNDTAMPTFTISPIGTAPNPLYLSNSFTISNILLMDGKVKL